MGSVQARRDMSLRPAPSKTRLQLQCKPVARQGMSAAISERLRRVNLSWKSCDRIEWPRLLRRARLANRPASLELIAAKPGIVGDDRPRNFAGDGRGGEHCKRREIFRL